MNRLNMCLLLLLAALQGCALGPDFTRPQPPRAARYTAEPLSIEGKSAAPTAQHLELGKNFDGDWWRLFNSSAIDQAVERALAGNRTLAAADATLAQAREAAAALAGTAAPQVGVTAGVGRQKYGAEFLGTLPKPPPFTYFAVGPSVSYTLDYTGGIARSVEQKYALADYQRQQLEAARLAVSGNAVMLTLRIASLRAQIATVNELLDRDRENSRLVHIAFDAGSVSRVDVLSAESQLAGDTALLSPLRQDLSVARHALSVVLGTNPGDRESARARVERTGTAGIAAGQPALGACAPASGHPGGGSAVARRDRGGRGGQRQPVSPYQPQRLDRAADRELRQPVRPRK